LAERLRASALNIKAGTYFRMREFKKSVENEEASLAVRRELFGDQQQGILTCVMNIVGSYRELQLPFVAIKFVDDFLKTITKSDSNYEILKTKRNELQRLFPRPGFRQLPKKRR
jgi:hypothetical protein